MQDKQRLPRTESVPLSNVANVLLTGHRARRGRYDAPQRPFADDNGTIGQVRIRNTLTSASSFIAAVIDRLSRRHPRIVFDVVPAAPEILHRELNERNLDLVITRGGLFKDEQFGVEILYDDSFVVLAGVQSPWARRRRIELADW